MSKVITAADRVQAAWQRRAPLHAAGETNTYRLINRAGDGFPDLTVDRYAEVLVAHLYRQGVPAPPPRSVLAALADWSEAQAIYVKYRPAQGNVLDGPTRRALSPIAPVIGQAVERVEVSEAGARYLIRPAEGLNPGLFLDMREVREFVRAQATGKTVLNCFAYTCSFGVAARRGGAARVLNLDISRHYLDWGRENVELNGFPTVATDFVKGDVFDWLQRFGKRGQQFDLVILDPPSYSTTHASRFSVERDTGRLVALAAKVVQPGGYLIAATNADQLPRGAFVKRVREGLAGAAAKVVHTWHEPDLDFPVASGAQPYLKVCVVKIG